METDRRIVPEKHIAYLLEEDTISERIIEVKKLLHDSPDKIHHIAHTWMGHSGLNPMARIIIHHIPEVPKKIHTRQHKETSTAHHDPFHHEDSYTTIQHGHENAHGTHEHGDHHSHTTGHHEDASHGHEHKHGANHHEHHGSEHHGGTFSSFVSTGHWFGDQGAYIFGMFGRLVGEIIGYFFKTLAVAIIFGPTRTALLVVLIGILLNTAINVQLPVGIAAGIAGIIHLIFTGINKMSGGHGESSHSGGAHGHGGGHGGGHGHH